MVPHDSKHDIEEVFMKLSKAAIRTRHVQTAHRTIMPAVTYVEEVTSSSSAPRTYSTDRHTRTNNGISIPQQLRDRIEASMPRPSVEESKTVPMSDMSPSFLSANWGFL